MFKVLLVERSTKELENLMNEGWIVFQVFNHTRGNLVFLRQEPKPETQIRVGRRG